MFLNLPEKYIEVFVLVGVLSGLGVGLVLQPRRAAVQDHVVESYQDHQDAVRECGDQE